MNILDKDKLQAHLVSNMDPMKEVTAPPLVTMGSSIPTMKRPMMGPVITPVIKVPTSSIPGKYLENELGESLLEDRLSERFVVVKMT